MLYGLYAHATGYTLRPAAASDPRGTLFVAAGTFLMMWAVALYRKQPAPTFYFAGRGNGFALC